MHLQHAPGLRADRVGVVLQMRAVGGAHFAQPGAGGGDQVGQPEPGADLDQLAAAHHHLRARRQCRGGEHQRGGTVVDHEGVLGCRTRGEKCLAGGDPALRAGAGGEVEFHVDVAARGDQRLDRARGQRGATQVGVHDDTGGVEDWPQRRGTAFGECGHQGVGHLVGRQLAAPSLLLDIANRRPDDVLAQPWCAPPAPRGARASDRCAESVGAGRPGSRASSFRGGGRESNPPDRDARSHRF